MTEFTEFEEDQIILLALDFPDFFYRVIRFMKPEYFDTEINQYIMTTAYDYYNKFDEVPTRDVLKNIIFQELKTDNELAEPIIEALNGSIDPRNVPFIKDRIITWAKSKQLALLYDEETIADAQRGDIAKVEQIINDAAGISDVIIKPFQFFQDVNDLFVEDVREHFTTGIPALDDLVHDGRGPARREVFLWIAPTGVGKSIMLVNTAVANVLQGKNVLHITLENSEKVTGHRYLGVFTNMAIALRNKHEFKMKEKLNKIKMSDDSGDLFVIYFPTDSVSVREIEMALKELAKLHKFVPDVIIIDYLECLISKNQYRNKEEYGRQKAVANEIRALAAVSNAFVASASQTNRSGSTAADENKDINLDKISESYGKAMPTDYIVSINQNKKDYSDDNANSHIGNFRFHVAKNRNGPKFKTVQGVVDYSTMKVRQEEV